MQFPLLPAHVTNGYCIRQYRYRIFPSSQKVHQWSNSCVDLHSSTNVWRSTIVHESMLSLECVSMPLTSMSPSFTVLSIERISSRGLPWVLGSEWIHPGTLGHNAPTLWMLSVACPHLCLFFMTLLCSNHLPTVSVPICFPKAFSWCWCEHSACTLGKPKVPRYSHSVKEIFN